MLPDRRHQIPFLSLAAVALLAGCGREVTGVTTDAGDPRLGSAIARLSTSNGLSQNGLSQNGLSQNGLSQNGLSQNGFSGIDFKNWFNADPALSNLVMTYVVKCAAAEGTTITWTSQTTGVTYTWYGLLGLALDFASGKKPTTAEQQVITACLAAHMNKYGLRVPIAIEGRSATGVQIPVGADELTTYSVQEACFFGNVFKSEGVYAGIDHAVWIKSKSSARACALDTAGNGAPSPDCPPMVFVGGCSSYCTLDASRTFYESCTLNLKTYKPLTTRLRLEEVYTCGDGVCQVSELCGTRSDWWDCSDCGACP